MTRPHPVVGFAAELADRRRGSTDQTDVPINLHHEREVLVATKERLDVDRHAGILGPQFLVQRLDVLILHFRTLLALGDRGDVAQHLGRYVDDSTDESDRQPRSRQLLLVGHGPETVLQVVVLHRREGLNRTVTAMVVGENESFGRYDLARTTVTENDDRILERSVIHRIDIFGRELAALGFHIPDVHLLKIGQKPHTLVCSGSQRYDCRSQA